jgi:hypothetical protein
MRSKPGYVEEELRKAREKYASDETEKEKQKAKVRAYKNKRYKNDPMFRLNRSMSAGWVAL